MEKLHVKIWKFNGSFIPPCSIIKLLSLNWMGNFETKQSSHKITKKYFRQRKNSLGDKAKLANEFDPSCIKYCKPPEPRIRTPIRAACNASWSFRTSWLALAGK